jgi:hypothetical protein
MISGSASKRDLSSKIKYYPVFHISLPLNTNTNLYLGQIILILLPITVKYYEKLIISNILESNLDDEKLQSPVA